MFLSEVPRDRTLLQLNYHCRILRATSICFSSVATARGFAESYLVSAGIEALDVLVFHLLKSIPVNDIDCRYLKLTTIAPSFKRVNLANIPTAHRPAVGRSARSG